MDSVMIHACVVGLEIMATFKGHTWLCLVAWFGGICIAVDVAIVSVALSRARQGGAARP